MRVAVCISGLPRFSNGCYESLEEKVLNRFPCDVFVHCWSDFRPDYICDTYQPTVCRYQQQVDFSPLTNKREGLFAHGWSSFASASMFYSLRAVNALKQEYERQHAFKYDYVIRTRFDVEVINFYDNLESVDPTKLHVASNIKEPAPPNYSDIFWLTGSSQDDIACDVYSRYEQVVGKLTWNRRQTCNEEILYSHIDGRIAGHFTDQVQARIARG